MAAASSENYMYANGHASSAELALPAELAPARVLTSPPVLALQLSGDEDHSPAALSSHLPEEVTNRVDSLLDSYMGRVRMREAAAAAACTPPAQHDSHSSLHAYPAPTIQRPALHSPVHCPALTPQPLPPCSSSLAPA